MRDWATNGGSPTTFISLVGPAASTSAPPTLPATPPAATDFAKEIDDAKREFDEPQKQLQEEVGNQLNKLNDFNRDYNAAWNKGMNRLDDYLHNYLKMLPGLKNLFDAFVDRNTALEMGHAIDEKIHQAIEAAMLVEGASGLIRGVAKWVAEDAALQGAEGLSGLAAKEGGGLAGKEAIGEGVEGAGEGRPPGWKTQKLGGETQPLPTEVGPPDAVAPKTAQFTRAEDILYEAERKAALMGTRIRGSLKTLEELSGWDADANAATRQFDPFGKQLFNRPEHLDEAYAHYENMVNDARTLLKKDPQAFRDLVGDDASYIEKHLNNPIPKSYFEQKLGLSRG